MQPGLRRVPLEATARVVSDEEDLSRLMSALVTEHFVLQSVSGSTIAESSSRSAIYLSALSSGLVAIGFASSKPQILMVFAFTILPTVFVLGCFTIVRLVDTSVENMIAVQRVERIRRYYATVHPVARQFFDQDQYGSHGLGIRGVRYRTSSVFYTMASMITFVNAVLGGVTVGLGVSLGVAAGMITGIVSGAAVGVVCLAAGLVYDIARIRPILNRSASGELSQ
jgi:hypothetical protein